MKQEYNVGETAWIYFGDHKGELTEGTVVHKFRLDGWLSTPWHYVIEIPTSIDPILEVRDPWTMSPAEDQPIGMWSRISND